MHDVAISFSCLMMIVSPCMLSFIRRSEMDELD